MSLTNGHLSDRPLRDRWTVNASFSTVENPLKVGGLKARVPRKKPYLNLQQRQRRVEWAKEHRNWSLEQWSKVLWSDESKLSSFLVMGLVMCGEDVTNL